MDRSTGWGLVALGLLLALAGYVVYSAQRYDSLLGKSSLGDWSRIPTRNLRQYRRMTTNGNQTLSVSLVLSGICVFYGVKLIRRNPSGWEI